MNHTTILIVDDEEELRENLQDLLEFKGYRVETFATGEEFLEEFDSISGDLVLLDIHMPGQDGLVLAHRLRALAWPPAIVFVTAHAEHALSAFELEAVDYLTKPVRLERLQQALAKVQRLRERPAPAPLAPPPASGASLLIHDRGRTERVPLAEVLLCKAELKYGTVRTAARSYVLDSTLAELEARLPEVAKNKALPLVLVCASGMRSSRAVSVARKLGYEKVFSLRGGMNAWKEANLPVSKT